MIRRRLLVAIVGTVAAVMAITGVVVVDILESRLVGSLDEQLNEFASQAHHVSATDQRGDHRSTEAPFDVRHMAIIELSPEAAVRSAIPAGPSTDPDPLPATTGLATTPTTPVTLPPVRGNGPDYRAIGVDLPDGGMVIAALRLTEVESAVTQAGQLLLAAGTAALALIAALAWVIIRRGLHPIDDMIDTAERIAEGDLAARTAAPDPDSEVGSLARALNTMLDRIQQAMATQAESEARMRRFVADASHELRTPLTSIRGYAELHRQGATSPDQVTRGLARIEHEAEHMATLVEDLLLLARLDQARPLAAAPVDLTRIVQEAASNARAGDPQRSIAVRVPDRPVVVRGDQPRLRQVLDNLLANIRDHTDSGTLATITLDAGDQTATLTIADDGPGMTPDETARAFDRFWQADPTPDQPRPGTGLGLAIIAELVAAHDGTITLDSTPTVGTSVTITLPTTTDRSPQDV